MSDERKETETLDRLYLEWSQFTSARTGRELAYRDALRAIIPLSSAPVRSEVLNILREHGDD